MPQGTYTKSANSGQLNCKTSLLAEVVGSIRKTASLHLSSPAWNVSQDEWMIISRCNRVALQLFSRDRAAADEFAHMAYFNWTQEGVPPEDLRNQRAPRLARTDSYRKAAPKRSMYNTPGA